MDLMEYIIEFNNTTLEEQAVILKYMDTLFNK
jgi:hypothetical protein